MSRFIEKPRSQCALGGALATVNALPGAVPIIHAAAGCGGNLFAGQNASAGYYGAGYCGGMAVPSSNVLERDIVFGGEGRLKQQIAKTLEIIKAELFVVVSGCMTDVIGDDINSVVNGFKEKGAPVLAAETGGFKGSSYHGYDLVLESLFRNFVRPAGVQPGNIVNLWGLVPTQDVFWRGNLLELKRLLNEIGLKARTFFAPGETLAELAGAAAAGLNIVVSDSYGVAPARVFEELHGVPYISTGLPIGPSATTDFLRQAGNAAGIQSGVIEQVIADELEDYFGYVEKVADAYNDLDLQRYTVVIGDANYSPALARFLAEDLGWLVELAVVSDPLSEDLRPPVYQRFAAIEQSIAPKVVFEPDTGEILQHLRAIWPVDQNDKYFDARTPSVVVGSALDRELAQTIGADHLSVTYPVSNRVVFDRGYAGFTGGLRLVEDLLTVLVGGR